MTTEFKSIELNLLSPSGECTSLRVSEATWQLLLDAWKVANARAGRTLAFSEFYDELLRVASAALGLVPTTGTCTHGMR